MTSVILGYKKQLMEAGLYHVVEPLAVVKLPF
jgi:hypothetical protein